MKSKVKIGLCTGISLIVAFVIWTVLVKTVDVKPLGQKGTDIGFATFNVWFHKLTGEHLFLYKLGDIVEIIPLLVCAFFGLVGVGQLIKRRKVSKVDSDIILLGIYYVVVILAYVFFEVVHINYRPVLIEGALEASYPSSTTLLVLSVMPTLKFQFDRRFKKSTTTLVVSVFVIVYSIFMLIARAVSGVHWATDIIGSILLSAGLFITYCSAVALVDDNEGKSKDYN